MDDRGDTLQRIQVGIIGLVAVLLLVSVANYVATQASDEQTAIEVLQAESGEIVAGDPEAEAPAEAPAEPLAELGMTPAPVQEEEVEAPATPNVGNAGQIVPDLTPDPKLEAPMDQEPQ